MPPGRDLAIAGRSCDWRIDQGAPALAGIAGAVTDSGEFIRLHSFKARKCVESFDLASLLFVVGRRRVSRGQVERRQLGTLL